MLSGTMHGTPVVVKVPRDVINPSKLQALGNELRLLRHLRHQSIVLFHGACVIEGEHKHFGLVLERVDGHALTNGVTFLSRQHALQISVALCRAVRYLHAQDPPIIHGDLKPDNVMVDLLADRAWTKVIDFGLSRRMGVGSLGGSKNWLSPEQLMDSRMRPSQSVDVFAFGSIVYYMQAHRPPMLGLTRQDFLSPTLDRPAGPIAVLSFLTDAASASTMDCLIFDPARRPSLAAVQAALEGCQLGEVHPSQKGAEMQESNQEHCEDARQEQRPTSRWALNLEKFADRAPAMGLGKAIDTEPTSPQDTSGGYSSGLTAFEDEAWKAWNNKLNTKV